MGFVKTLFTIIFVLMLFVSSKVEGQTPVQAGRCGSPEIQHILNDINKRRVGTNTRTPFVTNQTLCELAYTQALVVANGEYPSGSPSRRNEGQSSTGVRDWLKNTDFKAYPDGTHAVDIGTFVTVAYNYETVMGYLFGDGASASPKFFTDNRWREIGIAQVVQNNNGTNFYNYVFIVGSQPNVLPIVGYQPNMAEHIEINDYHVTNLTFWVSNEHYYTGSDSNTLGRVLNVAIDESEEALSQLSCQPKPEDGNRWQPYQIKHNYEAKGGIGERTLFIRLCDQSGRSAILEKVVNVIVDLPDAPTAAFDANVTSGQAPLTVQFTNNSSTNVTSWEWDFNGDGIIDSTEPNATFTFAQPGTFIASLKVQNGLGQTAIKEQVISVSAPVAPPADPPVAKITASATSGNAPLVVDFDATGSSGQIQTYLWDFNNDGLADSNAAQTQHRFTQPGEHTVTLKVSGAGGQHTDSIVISVASPPMVDVRFVAQPNSGKAPLSVTFANQSSDNVTRWDWDFDSDTHVDSTEKNPTYTYNTPGQFVVRLTGCDAGGQCKNYEQNITVEANVPDCPIANFSASPLSGTAPLQVQFTNTSTGQLDRIVWDFQSDNIGDSHDHSPTHIFPNAGTFHVNLTVSNACGSHSTTQQVQVLPAATAIQNEPVQPPTSEPTVTLEPTLAPTQQPTVTVAPTQEPTQPPTQQPTVTIAPTQEPIEVTEAAEEPTPTATGVDVESFVLPVELILGEDYAALVNNGTKSIPSNKLLALSIVPVEDSKTEFPFTKWSEYLDSEALHPDRCLVVYATGDPYPGLDEMRTNGIHCGKTPFRVAVRDGQFWTWDAFNVTLGDNVIAHCIRREVCIFDADQR